MNVFGFWAFRTTKTKRDGPTVEQRQYRKHLWYESLVEKRSSSSSVVYGESISYGPHIPSI